jgi:hypothetical protein
MLVLVNGQHIHKVIQSSPTYMQSCSDISVIVTEIQKHRTINLPRYVLVKEKKNVLELWLCLKSSFTANSSIILH